MPNTLFNRYKDLAARAEITMGTEESMEWFRNRIRKSYYVNNIINYIDIYFYKLTLFFYF